LTGWPTDRDRRASPRSAGSWTSALDDDGAVFHAHAQVLFDALRLRLRRGDNVVLCGFEDNNNVGDSAIYLATIVLLRSLGVSIEASVPWMQSARMLPAFLRRDTRVVFVGGGNFGDVYPVLHRRRLEAVTAARGHLVIQLPVSTWFRDPVNVEHTADVLATHDDVVLFARDQQSVERLAGVGLVPNLVPDTVAMLTAQPGEPDASAAPILWLARADDESAIASPPREPGVEVSDWAQATEEHVARSGRFLARLPDAAFRRLGVDSAQAMRLRGRFAFGAHGAVSRLRSEPGLEQIGRHRVVVTDRLHGHLLACLARRPNVIVENLDGKVGAYYETWSKELGLTTKASGPREASALARTLL